MHKIDTLPNGVRIVTREMHDSESVTVSFFIGAGGRYEDFATEYGAAHFIEHLLFKGTNKRPGAKIISEEIDGVGGYTNAYTAADHTSYYIKLPKQHFGLACDILTDILTDPLFDQTEIDRERGVVIEEMKVYKDDPARYVYDLTGELLWPKSTLRTNVLGTEHSISSMTRQTLIDYFKSLYTMDNLVVSVAGNITRKQVLNELTGLLGQLKSHSTRSFPKTIGSPSAQTLNILKQETNQAHLVLTGRAPSVIAEDEPVMRLLCTILGGGMSSRLHLSVREEKGLAYSIWMGMDTFLDTGNFEIYAGVGATKVEETLRAIMEELVKIQSKPVEEAELAKAKEQMRGRLIMGMESNGAVADMLGSQLIVTGRTWSLDEILAKIDEVSSQDILRAAKKYLASNGLRLAMIGPFGEAETKQFETIIKE